MAIWSHHAGWPWSGHGLATSFWTRSACSRHGDFFTAILKTQPAMINDWQSRQWSKFFCLSVHVTTYLNDHQRDAI
ncbi:TPA: Member of the CCCH zinc finger [Trebouxia sp. C0006]